MEFMPVKRKKMDIPIIPLIDILTILLIFFIVTTTFKEPKPVLNVEVPVATGVATSQSAEKRSTLTVTADGKIAIDAVQVLPGELDSYLEAFISVNPGRKLELKIDQACPFGTMVIVWESLTKAGIGLKDVPHRVRLPEASQSSAQ